LGSSMSLRTPLRIHTNAAPQMPLRSTGLRLSSGQWARVRRLPAAGLLLSRPARVVFQCLAVFIEKPELFSPGFEFYLAMPDLLGHHACFGFPSAWSASSIQCSTGTSLASPRCVWQPILAVAT